MTISTTPLAPEFKLAKAECRGLACAGYALILVAFGVCGLWAATAPLDSAAIAPGLIEVDSRSKPIQHMEGGIMAEVLVREAEAVRQGQALFRLDPAQAQSRFDSARQELDVALAREARLAAEVDDRSEIAFPADLVEHASAPSAATAMLDERRELGERKRTLEIETRALQARIDQTLSDLGGKERQKSSLSNQLAIMDAELASLRSLTEKGLFARNRLLEQERVRAQIAGSLDEAATAFARYEKQADETRADLEHLRQKAREDAARDLAEIRSRLPGLRDKLAVGADVLSRLEIRAPAAGVVQNLRVSGPGAVVKAGETLADFVPVDERLVVDAHVSPLDIDGVAAGEKAEIRFTALPRRQTPTVFGVVESVSAEAIVNENTHQSYYLARVVLQRADMPEAVTARLKPGMPADVLIVTGERTALEYLLEPLRNAFAKSLRER
jgi:HlyD family secretion protein